MAYFATSTSGELFLEVEVLGGRKSGEVEIEKYETSRGAKSFSNSVV